MEIAFVGGNPEFVRPGGMMVYVMNLINYYSNKNVNVSLIAPSNKPNKVYPYHLIPICNKEDITSLESVLYIFINKKKLCLSSNCIIHAQRSDEMFPFVLFYRKNLKILTLHGAHIKNVYKKRGKIIGGLYGLIEGFVLRHVDKIISVSDENKNYFLNKYPFIKNKIVVIPVSIDLNIFKPLDRNDCKKKYGFDENDKVILYVGRFEKEKRIEIIINIYNEIIEDKRFSNIKLLLVGSGKEKNQIYSQTVKNQNIFIKGPVSHNEIPEILNCSDVLILSSLYEGMPTVVLEALACGVPVVSTDVGDINKVVINGKTGYVVKIGDEDRMADKIKDILSGNSIQKRNCIGAARDYSIDTIAESIMGVYNGLINKRE
ncbi:MAG: glycosyltransferase family 4 protein [Candidatus Methanoperedens sp.]|nr:glycosyltransferase family 4 protein [Candidatus Methanoperedens sp.]